MYYPDELVEEVRGRSDIVDVVSSYVRLTKKGSNYFGLCPFHNEKSPSFSVNPDRQTYKCFGCGDGGNVITFVMKYENMSFPEALKLLAERAGVELPKDTYSEEARKRDSLKNQILEVNREAGKYYYFQLRSEYGKNAYAYLTGRSLSDDTIKKFGLGYAMTGQDLLYRYLKSKDFSDELLAKSGIFNIDDRRGMTDKFWNRVIFPIMDINHRIIGFGGRVMGDGKPKYLNSPETIVFDKGRNLYGLNLARTSRKKNMILCEGYMDTIALHQAGFNQAVASLGTAFTSGQASLLRRYTEEVLLTYDSDSAGVNAALRAIPILREQGINARVIDMKPYKDPDEFIKNMGNEAFEERIRNAENSFFFEVRITEGDYDLKDPDGRTRFALSVAKKLLRFSEDIERDNYLEAIASKYSMNPDNLRKLVAKEAMKGEGIKVYEKPKSGINSAGREEDKSYLAERMLLTWLMEEPHLYGKISPYIGVDDFTDELYRTVATIAFEQLENGSINPAMIIGCFTDEEEMEKVASMFATDIGEFDTPSDKGRALKELLIRVKNNSLNSAGNSDMGDFDELGRMLENKRLIEEIGRLMLEVE